MFPVVASAVCLVLFCCNGVTAAGVPRLKINGSDVVDPYTNQPTVLRGFDWFVTDFCCFFVCFIFKFL